MMPKQLNEQEKEIRKKFYTDLDKIKEEKIKQSEFQIGDKVKVTWTSRDFGRESANAFIHIIMPRINGYNGFGYYFRKEKVNGETSKHWLNFPKYSKILMIQKIK